MTLTLTSIDEQAVTEDGERWRSAYLTDARGSEHVLRLSHAEGDPAPTWTGVRDHLAALPEGHDLAGAHLEYRITKREYLDRFEQTDLRRVRDADLGLGDWTPEQRTVAGACMTYLDHVENVDLTNERTIELVHGLEAAGVIVNTTASDVLITP